MIPMLLLACAGTTDVIISVQTSFTQVDGEVYANEPCIDDLDATGCCPDGTEFVDYGGGAVYCWVSGYDVVATLPASEADTTACYLQTVDSTDFTGCCPDDSDFIAPGASSGVWCGWK